MAFLTKRENKPTSIYTVPLSDSAKTIFTYDFLTVSADEFQLNKKSKEIVAKGKVALRTGQTKLLFSHDLRLYCKEGKMQYSEITP